MKVRFIPDSDKHIVRLNASVSGAFVKSTKAGTGEGQGKIHALQTKPALGDQAVFEPSGHS